MTTMRVTPLPASTVCRTDPSGLSWGRPGLSAEWGGGGAGGGDGGDVVRHVAGGVVAGVGDQVGGAVGAIRTSLYQ